MNVSVIERRIPAERLTINGQRITIKIPLHTPTDRREWLLMVGQWLNKNFTPDRTYRGVFHRNSVKITSRQRKRSITVRWDNEGNISFDKAPACMV